MELEELKENWIKSNSNRSLAENFHDRNAIIQIISRSRRGIQVNFWIEILISLVLYISFIIGIVLLGDQVYSFLYKIVFTVTLVSIPIYYRMFQSYQFLKRVDYGRDIKENLIEFLLHYKTSLQFYLWGTYFIITICLVLLATDASFLALGYKTRFGIIFFVILLLLMAKPMIYKFYGREVRGLEKLLKE